MAKGKAETLFRSKAPGIMAQLMQDFPIELQSAAAIVGNFGHESAGFTAMQEIKPVVAGSRGGYGWPMWTGPRRRAYEAYCARNKLDPTSDKANYAYVFVELKGPEKKAIPAVQAAVGLEAKVKAFELAFERAGAKHYASRNQWARIALDAWHKAEKKKQAEKPASAQTLAPTPSSAPPGTETAPVAVPDSERPASTKPAAVKLGFWGKVLAALGIGGGTAIGGTAQYHSGMQPDQVAASCILGGLLICAVIVSVFWWRGR